MVCFFYNHNRGIFMTIRIFAQSIILSLALACTVMAQTQLQTLRIVADEWPPMTGSSLNHGGFSLQLTQEVLQALGYQTSVEFIPWKRIMRTRKLGEFEVVSAMWKDEGREVDFHFSAPYLNNKVLFVSLNERAFHFTNMSGLDNKRVGIVYSYA
jgi:polar amino acid transport system substrate-binding protein